MSNKVKKVVYSDEFISVDGLTKKLEEHLQEKVDVDHRLTSDELKNTFTYSFAINALENNSPMQLINVLTTIKKRYMFKLTKQGQGFLDAMIAKGYAYVALYSSNLYQQDEAYNCAIKYFKSSVSKGYKKGMQDAIDFKNKCSRKYSTPTAIENSIKKKTKDFSDVKFNIANMYFAFSLLSEDAVRVSKNRRPFISSKQLFDIAKERYGEYKDSDCRSAIAYGLCLIIEGNSKEGISYIKKNMEEFKELNKDCEKVLFDDDAKLIKKCINEIETNFLKNKKTR